MICSFCQKDFEILNRHSWRRKENFKHHTNKDNHDSNSVSNNCNTVNLDHNDGNNDCPKYICGNMCKGFCGLKICQRSSSASIYSKNNNMVNDNTQ